MPRLLVSTPLSSNLGHTYWEYRFDAALDDSFLKLAREVVTMDHAEEDELLEVVLTQAFFSFQTNKRIFQQLVHLSNQERWHNLWIKMADKSRWELSDSDVADYGDFAIGYVVDFLRRGASSLSQRLDPTGSERLALAKKLRRQSFREARREAGRELAAAPITAAISGEAGRILAAQPIPQRELSVLAAVYFPDPGRPSRRRPTATCRDGSSPARRGPSGAGSRTAARCPPRVDDYPAFFAVRLLLAAGFLPTGVPAFPRLSWTRNFTIRLIRSYGIGWSSGNCTDPFALLYGESSRANASIPLGSG